jgi:phosphatidylethanolamine-binding protein (PEBP) family uncharacterized protein
MASRRALSASCAAAAASAIVVAITGCGGSQGAAGSSQSTATEAAQTAAQPAPSRTAASPPSASAAGNRAAAEDTHDADTTHGAEASASASSAQIVLSSPALHGNREVANPIAARYTCAGANVSLPLKWGAVPHGTRELGVFVMNHVQKGRLAADWVVVGLRPTVKAIPTGGLPAGAIVGRNSAGQNRYSVCPAKGKKVEYGVFVFALRHPLHAHTGFNPVPVFERLEAGEAAGFGLIGFTSKR